jgi:hypothetical protein
VKPKSTKKSNLPFDKSALSIGFGPDGGLKIAPLTFSASWLESPDTVAVELVAYLAGQIAQSSALVDVPPPSRH